MEGRRGKSEGDGDEGRESEEKRKEREKENAYRFGKKIASLVGYSLLY